MGRIPGAGCLRWSYPMRVLGFGFSAYDCIRRPGVPVLGRNPRTGARHWLDAVELVQRRQSFRTSFRSQGFELELPFEVPAASIPEVARLLLALNSVLPIGALGLIEAAGRVYYSHIHANAEQAVEAVIAWFS